MSVSVELQRRDGRLLTVELEPHPLEMRGALVERARIEAGLQPEEFARGWLI